MDGIKGLSSVYPIGDESLAPNGSRMITKVVCIHSYFLDSYTTNFHTGSGID